MIFRGSIEKRCVENQIVLSAIALAGRAHQDRERGGVEGPSKKWNGGTEEGGGAAWPNNHHLRLQKEARQLGRDNATTGRAIYKAFMGDETIFMPS